MKRAARLQAARNWLTTFRGQRVVRSYARWFGVDLGCALRELQLLGVELDPQYVERLRTMLSNRSRPREAAPCLSEPEADGYGEDWDDNFAYIAGFTTAGFPFGTTWDELDERERRTLEEQRGMTDAPSDDVSSAARATR